MSVITIDYLLAIQDELDKSKEKSKQGSIPLMCGIFKVFGADFDRGDKLILKPTDLFTEFANSVNWLYSDRVVLDKNSYLPAKMTHLVIKGDEIIKPMRIKFEHPVLLNGPNYVVNLNVCP